MPRRSPFLPTALLAAFLAACATPRVPLATVPFPGPSPSRILVVLLPGRGSTASSYEDEGFVAAARRAGVRADLLGVEAHLGYYRQGSVARRLHEDVVAPALARGYGQVWLVGISLGGTGALWYDVDYPGEADGVVAFAPFLGAADLGQEIAAAGGLARWEPGEVAPGSDLRFLWKGLRGYEDPGRTRNRVYLAYGLGDDFAPLDGLLAAALPPDQVVTTPGAHDWDTWRRLWEALLRGPLAALREDGRTTR